MRAGMLARLAAGIERQRVPAGTYLALRQVTGNVIERGDVALNTSAEALAARVAVRATQADS